jgi:hypothetical protein
VLSATGLALTLATFFWSYPRLSPLLGSDARRRDAFLFCLVPYFLGGLIKPAAALLNPHASQLVLATILSALGGKFLLVWIPTAVRRRPLSGDGPALPVRSGSVALLTLALVLTGLFVAVLGPGFRP